MAVTTTYVETSDFPTTPRPLTGNIGETMDNADGFSGNIIATADSSTYEAADYDTGGLRYYMGTLWLGGITNPSNQTVNLIITTNDTDIALFECTPSAGSAPTNIIFDGSNDSISMAPEVILSGASGEVMDLSKTGIYQYTGSSTAPLENAYVIIHGTGTGNDTFTGSASTNVLYEGTGNSNFYQSAGNDLISCSGGSSIYHANDVWANYEGGYQDQSGNNFLNNGEDWLFRDHGTGKIIELTNVPTVIINGVTYSSSNENAASLAWSNTTSGTTAATASAYSGSLRATLTGTDILSTASTTDLHKSVLADFAVAALGSASVDSISSGSGQSAAYDDHAYSASGAAVLLTQADHSSSVIAPNDQSSSLSSI